MTLKDFFSFKKNRLFWINIIAMAVVAMAALFVTMSWLDHYTHHGESVQVPDLRTMSAQQAIDKLAEQGLVGTVSDSTYAKGMLPGTVIQHTPLPGSSVKRGRLVYLTVSTSGAPAVNIPDIINNSSLREAEARLKVAGFKLGEPELVPGEAKDWVVGLKSGGRELTIGDKLPEGSTISIMVGAGDEGLLIDSTAVDSFMPAEENPIESDNSWF